MLDVIRGGLQSADEIAVSVSFLRCSGLGLILDDLKDFTSRGGRARILTSTYMGVTQPEALSTLLQFSNVESRVHVAEAPNPFQRVAPTGFHTKFFIFRKDESECWVGSSNLTKGGLAANIEANLHHKDMAAIKSLQDVFERLWTRDDVVPLTPQFTKVYSSSLLAQIAANRKASELIQEHITPNEVQIEALERLKQLRASGETRAAVIAAPGVGKTFLAAFDAQVQNAKSVLFISHRLEHLSQALRTFRQVFRGSRTYGMCCAGSTEANADFVFSTVQSATRNPALLRRHFEYVVIDEFHHAEARSYLHLLRTARSSFLLGLTATPERQDGHDVLRLCDYNVAYEVRLIEAINKRWLLPFHYFGVSDESVDYANIPWRSGRFETQFLENALMLEDRVDEIIRHALSRGYDGPKRATIGFCAGVRHAKFMADAFVRRGYSAAAITGEDDLNDRELVYQQFEDVLKPLEWIFVADVLNEGVDLPAINSILFLRPTESPTIFIQQLGRGLRLSPDCEVLTVLDFVGHHKSAWLSFAALHDKDAGTTPSTIADLNLTPPRDCEVVLDSKTIEILKKIRKHTESKRDFCIAAYLRLKEDATRPFPVDLLGRNDMPDMATVRSSFGSWIGLRKASKDALPWEDVMEHGSIFDTFLSSIERDWQQPRVYSYALLWGLCHKGKNTIENAYDAFFDRFPRWRVEHKPLNETKAWQTLRKKIGKFIHKDRLDSSVLDFLPQGQLVEEIEGRLRFTLERDYRLRYGGTLREPHDLMLHRRYDRNEIINYFGVQYDPARHNSGFIVMGNQIIIITKLDTSGADAKHQYVNQFTNEETFAWQSQNKMRRDNPLGRRLLDHEQNEDTVHLFVLPRSHEKAYYCGRVKVMPENVTGDAPINVQFALDSHLPEALFRELTRGIKSQEAEVVDYSNILPGSQADLSDPSTKEDGDRRSVGGAISPVHFLSHKDIAGQEYQSALPYVADLAAGYFRNGFFVDSADAVEDLQWVEVAEAMAGPRRFIIRIAGDSMSPTLEKGNLCVFEYHRTPRQNGQIVIAADFRSGGDGEYAVKRYEANSSIWRFTSDNPEFESIEIPKDSGSYPILGTFVAKLA